MTIPSAPAHPSAPADTLKARFPDAIPISAFQGEAFRNLTNAGLTVDHAIWATSLCSDEVSNDFREFYEQFASPGPFILGGISGLPFAGITGMRAFLSHVPDGGMAMILFGPHIGLTADGTLGKVNRHYQDHPSTCCGSLAAALRDIAEQSVLPQDNPLDYQQARVVQHLHEAREEILASPEPLLAATEVAYRAIETKLYRVLTAAEKGFEGIRVCLTGGIVINTDWGSEDHILVRRRNLVTLGQLA